MMTWTTTSMHNSSAEKRSVMTATNRSVTIRIHDRAGECGVTDTQLKNITRTRTTTQEEENQSQQPRQHLHPHFRGILQPLWVPVWCNLIDCIVEGRHHTDLNFRCSTWGQNMQLQPPPKIDRPSSSGGHISTRTLALAIAVAVAMVMTTMMMPLRHSILPVAHGFTHQARAYSRPFHRQRHNLQLRQPTKSSHRHGSVGGATRRMASLPHDSSLNGQVNGNNMDDAPKTATTLPNIPANAHRVVFMRHGESEFNNANIFTGWCDVALTRRGVVEAIEAGQVFRSHGLVFQRCYTSLLTRSIVTAHRALEAAGVSYTPLEYEWRLNERHYGALQGLSKERTAVRLGRERVMRWRRSFEGRPPLMASEHPHHDTINNDPRYSTLESVPLGESLQDCQERVVDAWKGILNDLKSRNPASNDEEQQRQTTTQTLGTDDRYTLVVAHANSLRALVMHLDDIAADRIESLNIPTAIPFYYDIDLRTGEVLNANRSGFGQQQQQSLDDVPGVGKFRGIYISDERKKRSFLERRRAANDPWLWALHDHQVDASMLAEDGTNVRSGSGNDVPGIVSGSNNDDSIDNNSLDGLDGLNGLEEEARQNTQMFSNLKGNLLS